MRISELSGNWYVRWEDGENRRFHMKHSCVVNETERSFGDLHLLQSDSNGDGSMDSMVSYSGNQELHPDLVCFLNVSR